MAMRILRRAAPGCQVRCGPASLPRGSRVGRLRRHEIVARVGTDWHHFDAPPSPKPMIRRDFGTHSGTGRIGRAAGCTDHGRSWNAGALSTLILY